MTASPLPRALAPLLALLLLLPCAAAAGTSLELRPAPDSGEIAPDAAFRVAIRGDAPRDAIRDLYVSLTRDGSPVAFTHRQIPERHAVEIRPDAPLAPGAEYRLAARCLAPDGPAADDAAYRVRRPAPRRTVEIVSCHPAPEAPCDDERPEISVRFSGPLMPARDGVRDGALTLEADGDRLPGETREEPDRLVFRPHIPLRAGTIYRARLAAGLRGIAGEALPAADWSFRLRDDVFRLEGSFPDATRRLIRSCDRLLLAFTQPLDARRDPRDFIKVVDAHDLAVPGEFLPQGDRTLLFVPEQAFPAGPYAILVSAEYPSRAGNALGRDLVIPFRVPHDAFNKWATDAARFNLWNPDGHERDRWAPDAR